jgi:hypothetical protein
MKTAAALNVLRTLSLSATLLLLASAHAQAERYLGATLLTRAENDVDVLRFAPCRADVREVQLRVRKSNAEINAVWVQFGNGERQTLEVRNRIRKGQDSRWIDLKGGERCIQSIGVIGDSEGSKRQARIAIYAR